MKNTEMGRAGEDFAAKVMEAEGFVIVERNFRCKVGEIDIIAEKQGELYFTEVKTRRGYRRGFPAESVTAGKQKRIRNAARFYLACRGGEDKYSCHFQVIEIMLHQISDAF